MRVFVALDIPEQVRSRISAFCAKLKGACPQARWARVENLHVTLKFVGEISGEIVERIKAELAAIRLGAPVEMSFRNVGFFPSDRRPRVFWIGIHATPNLAKLAAETAQRLEPLDIPREPRPFRPHLTLARFNSHEGIERLREELGKVESLEFGSTQTGKLHLYRSELKPGGAQYTRLETVPFATFAGGAKK